MDNSLTERLWKNPAVNLLELGLGNIALVEGFEHACNANSTLERLGAVGFAIFGAAAEIAAVAGFRTTARDTNQRAR